MKFRFSNKADNHIINIVHPEDFPLYCGLGLSLTTISSAGKIMKRFVRISFSVFLLSTVAVAPLAVSAVDIPPPPPLPKAVKAQQGEARLLSLPARTGSINTTAPVTPRIGDEAIQADIPPPPPPPPAMAPVDAGSIPPPPPSVTPTMAGDIPPPPPVPSDNAGDDFDLPTFDVEIDDTNKKNSAGPAVSDTELDDDIRIFLGITDTDGGGDFSPNDTNQGDFSHDDEVNDSENGRFNPNHKYNNYHIPDFMNKKQHDSANSHLPTRINENDLVRLLFASAAKGKVDVLRSLLDMNMDANTKTEAGDTALMTATMHGQLNAARQLLLRGAKADIKNKQGNVALHVAAATGRTDVSQTLLSHKSDIDIQNEAGDTPLMVAVMAGKYPMVRFLLLRGAVPDIQNDKGLTALHLAAYRGDDKMVDVLIQYDADPTIRTQNDTSSEDLALASRSPEAARIIREAIWYREKHRGNATAFAERRNVSENNDIGIVEKWTPPAKDDGQWYKNAFGFWYKQGGSLPKEKGTWVQTEKRQWWRQDELQLTKQHILREIRERRDDGSTVALRVGEWAQADDGAWYKHKGGRPRAGEFEYADLSWKYSQNTDGNWFIFDGVNVNYSKLAVSEQRRWNRMLTNWLDADQAFDDLSDEEKREWNEKRKILIAVFPEHFTADTPDEQKALDDYMAKWQELDQKDDDTGAEENKTSATPQHETLTVTQLKDIELRQIMGDWELQATELDNMTDEERIAANEKRLLLLNQIGRGTNSEPGEYTDAFEALPQEIKDSFIATMAPWEQFDAELMDIDSNTGSTEPPLDSADIQEPVWHEEGTDEPFADDMPLPELMDEDAPVEFEGSYLNSESDINSEFDDIKSEESSEFEKSIDTTLTEPDLPDASNLEAVEEESEEVIEVFEVEELPTSASQHDASWEEMENNATGTSPVEMQIAPPSAPITIQEESEAPVNTTPTHEDMNDAELESLRHPMPLTEERVEFELRDPFIPPTTTNIASSTLPTPTAEEIAAMRKATQEMQEMAQTLDKVRNSMPTEEEMALLRELKDLQEISPAAGPVAIAEALAGPEAVDKAKKDESANSIKALSGSADTPNKAGDKAEDRATVSAPDVVHW